jgi:hypothetical protein
VDYIADRFVWDQTFSEFYDKDLEVFVSGTSTTESAKYLKYPKIGVLG